MSKPRVVRRATWRELRVLVTTANGPQLLEHVDQPNVYWARNCSDFIWTAEDVPLLHIGAAGKAVPLQVAWKRDIGAASSFAAIPQQLLGVRVGGFLLDLEVPSVGVVAIGATFSLLGFSVGLPRASAVAIVRLVHGHVFGAVRPCHGFVQGGLRWESLEVEADAVEAQVASVREDGLTHFICLTFDIIVWMFSCTRQFFMSQTWVWHT